ncbi:DUF4349 domain-containing protein [Hymenobacter aerophilus]|uniref:DUF4349 domain-containing protein n=1 Tax=Hymenobacter aerophilus TaxID=119644 RepID=UPI00036D0C4B|nr:DUF4349 domain-containing protein [Hymenobacter aerophilus]
MKNYAHLLLPALLLAACSQAPNHQDQSVAESEPVATFPAAATASTSEPGSPAASSEVPLARLWRATGHPVIYQGSMELEVSEFEKASARLDTLLSQYGAYLTDANETTDADRHQQMLVIRVPSARFLALTSRLSRLGRVQSKQISSRDIAAELARQQATAATATDTAVANRAAAVSQLLTEQAALGTLRLTYFQLRPASDLTPAAAIGPRLVAGLEFGWRLVGLLLVGLAYGWPLLLGLVGWGYWRWRQGAFIAPEKG